MKNLLESLLTNKSVRSQSAAKTVAVSEGADSPPWSST